MNKFFLAGIALIALAFTSCDNDTENIGTSLTDNMDHLQVDADTFTVTTNSVIVDSVLSRNSVGYLGRIKDPETGAYITGDFMAQFSTLEDYTLPSVDSIISKKNGQVIADSCDIRLFYKKYYGDSLATMKLTAYEMNKPMEENVNYYSNFNPMANGYIRTNGIKQSKVYTLYDMSEDSSTHANSNYVNNICIKLNKQYTDKDGKTYNNFGTYLMRKCYEHPEYFKNAYNLIHNVMPGFYFKIDNGLGSMAYIAISRLNVYFRYTSKDSIYIGTTSFSGTEEVLQTTKISNTNSTMKELAEDNTCTYLKTPSGIFTQMTLPIDDIVKGHENDTINTAKVVLTRINNETQSKYALSIPKTLLLLPTDSVKSFFENDKIANYKRSFITTYSSTYNTYTFNNISSLVSYLATAKKNGEAKDGSWVSKHPNWNKVTIIPVTATYNTSSTLTKIVHDMSLTSTRLVGGNANKYEPIKISVIYSKFK